MHERSLARALLHQVRALMLQHAGRSVQTVHVSVGEFCGVDADLLAIAFAEESAASELRTARLSVERVPLEARCAACGNLFAVQNFRFVCPGCGCGNVQVERGEELMLERLTLVESVP